MDKRETEVCCSPGGSLRNVVEGGYCVGCGACAAMSGTGLRMRMNELGCYQPVADEEGEVGSAAVDPACVCPFGERAEDEASIGRRLFGKDCRWDDRIGYHAACYAGYTIEGSYRTQGSSGGLGSWVLVELLRVGWIDAVIHVAPMEDSTLFSYRVSRDAGQIMAGAKSRYYPIELATVLKEVRELPGRYALVGLPCFIKAFHLLAKTDVILAQRVKFTVGLVCGHLKSAQYASMLGWQIGATPGQLKSIDFRHKLAEKPAHRYGTEITYEQDGKCIRKVADNDELFGLDWGPGLFQYNACDYCDDVVAETADITIGDAWLPRFVKDSAGTNIVIVREPRLAQLVARAAEEKRIWLTPLSADEVARSQQGGLRHRRDGLAYRLHLKQLAGAWAPRKRVKPAWRHLSANRRQIMQLRMGISRTSHLAFAAAVKLGSFQVFRAALSPLLDAYHDLYRVPRWKALPLCVLGGLRRRVRALGRKWLGIE